MLLALTLPITACCAPPAPPLRPVVIHDPPPGKPFLPSDPWRPDPWLADLLLDLAERLRAEAAGLPPGDQRAALLVESARALERAHVEGTRAEVYVGQLEEAYRRP